MGFSIPLSNWASRSIFFAISTRATSFVPLVSMWGTQNAFRYPIQLILTKDQFNLSSKDNSVSTLSESLHASGLRLSVCICHSRIISEMKSFEKRNIACKIMQHSPYQTSNHIQPILHRAPRPSLPPPLWGDPIQWTAILTLQIDYSPPTLQ